MADFSFHDPLLHHLLAYDVITRMQAAELISEHDRTGKTTQQLLVEMEILDEQSILNEIAEYLGTTTIDLSNYHIEPETLHSISAGEARMHTVIPVEVSDQAIVLATSELISPDTMDALSWGLDKDVSFVVATESQIKELLDQHYGEASETVSDLFAGLEEELAEAGELKDKPRGDIIDLEQEASSAPVIRFVNLILYQAVQNRASDIHFEPFETDFKIRYRVDGALYEMSPPPKHLALPVISRLKVMSNLDIAERRLPQDGRIQLNIGGSLIDFRVSTLPTQHGESVVLRVLDRSAVGLDIENLGLPDDVYNMFLDDIRKPNGIVIVSGPTGSGKTTTLYSALRRINEVGTKLLTAEQPVEYEIDGIIQCGANEQVGVTFTKLLRAFLRQDPDVILVGEIRDHDTAQIAIQASLTGHLVFSTLHTNDAAGAVTRLIDMDIEPFLIASTLESVLGTRLLRTICKECKTTFIPDDEILASLNMKREEIGDQPFYYGAGCSVCNNSGYRGRRGIYEYLRVSDPIRDLITEKKPTVVMREKARELGMRTLREDGIRCMLDGYTTYEEVMKYT